LEADGPLNSLFLDHLLQAAAVHVIQRYGETASIKATGGLSPQQLARAKEIMNARISHALSLKQIATECGLSVTHFARAFRQSTGVAPYLWFQQMRLERARKLLAGRERSLAEIAVACGFSDQSHFTRMFRKYIGESPGRWRQYNRS
jgi:transcriptional regulator GlxA family with amidase domain